MARDCQFHAQQTQSRKGNVNGQTLPHDKKPFCQRVGSWHLVQHAGLGIREQRLAASGPGEQRAHRRCLRLYSSSGVLFCQRAGSWPLVRHAGLGIREQRLAACGPGEQRAHRRCLRLYSSSGVQPGHSVMTSSSAPSQLPLASTAAPGGSALTACDPVRKLAYVHKPCL